MKQARVLFLAIIFICVGLLQVTSCSNDSNPVRSKTADIEIKGIWQGSFSGDNFLLSITNSSIAWQFDQIGDLSSDLVEYNNDEKTYIVLWTDHPAYLDMYQKFVWLTEPADTVTIRGFGEWNTVEEASDDTQFKYDPITLTKM